MHSKNQSPTIADVAERAGVSIATVSRVLNGTVPVQAEKAERVRLAMDELQFVPRTAARVLASKRTHTIGLILPEISGAFFSPMLRGIESQAHEIDYDLLIHSMHATLSNPNHSSPLGEHNTDGLLVFTNSLDERRLARLHHLNFPVVLLHQTPPESLNIPVITIENKDGAVMLMNHLIEVHNRRRIVFLRGPVGHEDSLWRERGYREALEARNRRMQVVVMRDQIVRRVDVQDVREPARSALVDEALADRQDEGFAHRTPQRDSLNGLVA